MLKPLLIILMMTSLYAKADKVSEADLLGETEAEEEIEEEFDADKYLEPIDEVDYKQVDEEVFEKVDPDIFEDDFPEINFELINKLKPKDINTQKVISNIVTKSSVRNFSFAEKEALKIKLKDIVKSGTFYGVVRRNTQLIHLRTGKVHYNQKLLTVRAYRKSDYEGYKLLINKNGFSTFKVRSHEIENIKVITNLYEEPHYYEPVKTKTNYKINDKDIKTKLQFNFHYGLVQSRFLRNLGRVENNAGASSRYEMEIFGKFDFPFKIGATLNYEKISAAFSKGGKYNVSSLSLGPVIKSKRFKLGEGIYSTFAQARHAVFSKATVKSAEFDGNFNLSQTSLSLGFEREVKTFIGDMAFGFNYQRQWVKPSSKNTSSNLSSKDTTTNAYLFTIGYMRDFL